MSQDLASLVIGLRADVATLQSDLGKANALNARYAKEASDTWTSAAADLAGKLVGALAVDRLIDFGRQAIDTADQFNKMSQKVGISVESLSSLNVQARLSDVAVDSLQGGLAKLARNAADAAAGGKEQAAAFNAMGVSLKDANGNLKSTEDILAAVAAKFAGYEDSAAKTALAQKAFGKSGADLIPLLNQLGEQGFKKAREEAEKYGQVISSKTAAEAEEFNDNLTKTGFGLSAIANSIVADLLPALVDSSRAFADWINSDAVRTGVKNLYDDVKGLVGILAQVPTEVAETDKAFRQWNGTLSENSGSLDVVLDKLKSFTNFKPGAPLTISWTMPDWLKWITTPSAGSSLDQKMTQELTKPVVDLKGALQLIAPTIDTASKGFDGLAQHVDASALAAKKGRAPTVDLGNAAEKAAKQHIQYSDALKQAGEALNRIQSLSAGFQSDINDIVMKMGGADDAQIAYVHALDDIAKSYQQLLELGPPTAEAVDAVGLASQRAEEKMNLTRTFDAQREAMKRYQEELQKTADMWGNFADAVFDAVTKSGNFLKNLLANLKDVVTQMLREWFRTSVIGTFTGTGNGGYSGLVTAGLGLVSAGSGGDFNMGGPSGASSAGNANLFGTAQQGYSLFGAGQKMWSGFQSGLSNFWSGSGGAGYSGSFNMGGPSGVGYNGAYGGYGSGFGQALGVAGSLYAGYNRYQQGGALGGFAGGATYAAGTYAAGAGLASAAAGTGFSAGVSGAFAAVPVVGWIALAAMLVDMVSGGKLFGTDGKFNFGKQQTFIGSEGATVVAGYDQKGQSALFGGSTHSWHDLPVAQEAIDAANEFFRQLKASTESFAKQFGTQIGTIVGGEFDTVFDKKGNVKSTSSIVNGVTYNEDFQHFSERLSAENMLAVLDQLSSGISAAVDKYRQDADQLMAVTQALGSAEMMIQQGTKFLALGADQSLTALLSLAQGAQQFGESIDQTLQRIEQAQAAYDQFVGQFKAPTSYVDDFEGALSQINATMLANIKQANALAQAAGAAGASEQDLANIHQYAAKQAAQLVQALEQSAQSLAFSLGLTTTGTLDQVNQEIASLQAKANQGAGAVSNFGKAITDAADAAKHAMDLLLGDLSPLNDQQKLQTALQGLRAGSVTQEQVLEIGRRLYASSQAYVNLFNTVQALGRNGSGALGSVGGAGVGASGGLTGAERQRLSDLLAQQSQLQSAAQLQQYQTLAQQIAEIASFKGVDFREVLKERGIDIGKFEAGLQMSDKQTQDYIASIQKQTDSNGENTKSIVDALNKIIVLLGGTPDSTSDIQAPDHPLQPGQGRGGIGSTTAPPPGSFGHSGHSRYEDGQELGRGFRDVILSTGPRGTRPGVPA